MCPDGEARGFRDSHTLIDMNPTVMSLLGWL